MEERAGDARLVDPRQALRGTTVIHTFSIMSHPELPHQTSPNQVTYGIPSHLATWTLPPDWSWGTEGVWSELRHYQEIVDALGRSLSLVTAPDEAHANWLAAEARALAHRNHPAIPSTYHYWANFRESRRGPGYLRRWIAGETAGALLGRQGPYDIPYALNVLRTAGSALAYLHDSGTVHGNIGPESVWLTPTGRLWFLGWQWALPRADIPAGLTPAEAWTPWPPEWGMRAWNPSAASDQWQLGALCFACLTGELPPARDVPPLRLVRPEVPQDIAEVVERALCVDPQRRFHSVAALLRAADRAIGSRTMIVTAGTENESDPATGELSAGEMSPEERLRWALGDDYEVLGSLGTGTFGSVWRVRDLALEREVALKMLHTHVAIDERALGRFRREARLAGQLVHPGIVPILDWDSRGDVAWYTMELAEGGAVGDLVARSGPRPLGEVAPQVDLILDALAAAHASGIVHRDLKPENILIDRYRRWRVSDFGIAHVAGEDTSSTTGTPAFAAPEQLLGEPLGPTADCFAVAAIVVFALSGSPPFGGGDAQQILARQLMERVDLAPYPAEIADWLRTGLAAAPEDRFAEAAAMQEAWRRAIDAAMEGDRQVPWWRRMHPAERAIAQR